MTKCPYIRPVASHERQQETCRQRTHHTESIQDPKSGSIKSRLTRPLRMQAIQQDPIHTKNNRHQEDIQRKGYAGEKQIPAESAERPDLETLAASEVQLVRTIFTQISFFILIKK